MIEFFTAVFYVVLFVTLLGIAWRGMMDGLVLVLAILLGVVSFVWYVYDVAVRSFKGGVFGHE